MHARRILKVLLLVDGLKSPARQPPGQVRFNCYVQFILDKLVDLSVFQMDQNLYRYGAT